MDKSQGKLVIKQGFKEGGEEGDLFRGTAPFYAVYRRPYPAEVVTYLVEEFGLDGHGRLLDAGCGTGQLFQVLAAAFDEVIAFDPDPAMVDHARRFAGERGLAKVQVLEMPAEAVGPELGSFRMAVFAASFHWTDRQRVAELVYDRLEPGGHLIVIAPCSPYSGVTEWEAVIRDVLSTWLGPTRRAGGGIYQQSEHHEQALQRTRFESIRTVDVYAEERWTIDQLVGYLYSTSFTSKEVLGGLAAGFEADLRERLARLRPDGSFTKQANYTVISAKRAQWSNSEAGSAQMPAQSGAGRRSS